MGVRGRSREPVETPAKVHHEDERNARKMDARELIGVIRCESGTPEMSVPLRQRARIVEDREELGHGHAVESRDQTALKFRPARQGGVTTNVTFVPHVSRACAQ